MAHGGRGGPQRCRLDAFYQQAAELAAPRLSGWRRLIEEGASATAAVCLEHLDALARGDTGYLADAAVSHIASPSEEIFMALFDMTIVISDGGGPVGSLPTYPGNQAM